MHLVATMSRSRFQTVFSIHIYSLDESISQFSVKTTTDHSSWPNFSSTEITTTLPTVDQLSWYWSTHMLLFFARLGKVMEKCIRIYFNKLAYLRSKQEIINKFKKKMSVKIHHLLHWTVWILITLYGMSVINRHEIYYSLK